MVSLANYTAPSDWEYMLHEPASDGDGGGATVQVNAGWSLLKLYSRIKPAGYTLPTQTALPIFQLGGMISNAVHGGIYTASFVSKYVKRLRVMAADGTIRLITTDSELRMWRNSYGLLGIITAIEFELLPVSAFQVTFVERSFTWSESSFWEFVLSDAMAGLQPADLPPNVTAAGSQKAFSGQFFMDLSQSTLGAEQVRIEAIVALMNENATAAGIPTAYYIPISKIFAALDALRTDVLARSAANDPGFMWNLPFDMQFLQVTDDAVLNVVTPGMYGVVGLLAPGITGARAADNQGWMKAVHTMLGEDFQTPGCCASRG